MLERYAECQDEDIDLIDVLLAFSEKRHVGISLDRYCRHFDFIKTQVLERFDVLRQAGSDDDAGTRLAALRDILMLDKDYRVVSEPDADPMIYADLIEVIERRAGVAVQITIIFVAVARLVGWDVYGLSVGGRSVCRIDHGGQRLVFDPAEQCRLLQAHDLRDILKEAQGEDAELLAHYFDPVLNRDLVLIVQNLIKLHQIRMEDYEGALETVKAMQVFAPAEHRLLLDAGVLYARTQQREAAIFALEHYVVKETDPQSRHEALYLLNDLREKPD